jgi:hypothetical protein
MPDPVTAVAGSSIVSGAMGASAAKSAAKTTADSTRYAADLQYKSLENARADLAPFRVTGYDALNEIGGGMAGRQPVYDEKGNITGFQTGTGYLTGQLTPQKIQEYLDPSMAFRMKYGTQATERLQNVGQGAFSGNTLRALNEYGQGLASTEFGNAFGRAQGERKDIYNILANIAGMGQGAVNTGVQAGQTTAQSAGQLAVGGAQAQAAGIVGAANALGGGIQNAGNMLYLNQLMKPNASTTGGQAYMGGISASSGGGGGVNPYSLTGGG